MFTYSLNVCVQLDVATGERQELDCENVPDAIEVEQTWPTAEEMMAAEQETKVTRVKKVQRGFSEYQAARIVDQEDSEDEGEDEQVEPKEEEA